MNTVTHEQAIIDRLDEIKTDIDFIKGRIIDLDIVMTEDDYSSITDAISDLKAGKTTRL